MQGGRVGGYYSGPPPALSLPPPLAAAQWRVAVSRTLARAQAPPSPATAVAAPLASPSSPSSTDPADALVPTPYGPGLLVAVQRLAPESGGGSRAVVRLGWATVALWVGPDALGTPLDAGAATTAAATTAATPAATPRTPPRPAPAVAAVVSPAAAAAATPARPPPLRFNSVRIVTQCVVQLELIATAGELIAEHLDALAPAHVDGLLALLQVSWMM